MRWIVDLDSAEAGHVLAPVTIDAPGRRAALKVATGRGLKANTIRPDPAAPYAPEAEDFCDDCGRAFVSSDVAHVGSSVDPAALQCDTCDFYDRMGYR